MPAGFGQVRTAKLLPVLTMVTGYARWASAVLIPTRRAEDLYGRLVAAHRGAGRGPAGAGLGWGRRRRPVAGRRTELTQECQGFRGTLAAKVIICRPADPEAKGLVERLHDYLERSFLPGRVFTCPGGLQRPAP